MDCRNIDFSAEKSHQRIERYLEIFSPELLNRIFALVLHLLGVKRQTVATMVNMPEESVKTLLSNIQKNGFVAIRDRRYSSANLSGVRSPSSNPTVTLATEGDYCVVNFSDNHEIRIRRAHQVHLRTLLLSLCHAGLLTTTEVSSALEMTPAHCRELARQLSRDDVVDVLIDQRQGQQQDYLVGADVKAQIIQYFAALAVTGRSTSGDALAKALIEFDQMALSPRTIRWHMNKLGLNTIKKTLPELVERLKKTSGHSH